MCLLYSISRSSYKIPSWNYEWNVSASGPVKTKILGEETKEKEAAATRVKADMNYQLTDNMVEYRPEHERLLYNLGLAGSAFKKVYYDPNLVDSVLYLSQLKMLLFLTVHRT